MQSKLSKLKRTLGLVLRPLQYRYIHTRRDTQIFYNDFYESNKNQSTVDLIILNSPILGLMKTMRNRGNIIF